MPECAVVICKNSSKKVNLKDHGISYHSFPKDPNIKEQWINATGKPTDWFPGKYSRICSIHFEAEMFQKCNKLRKLFEWAIPKLKLRHIFTSDININKLDVFSMTAGSTGDNSPLSIPETSITLSATNSIETNCAQVRNSTRKRKFIEIDKENIKNSPKTSNYPTNLIPEDIITLSATNSIEAISAQGRESNQQRKFIEIDKENINNSPKTSNHLTNLAYENSSGSLSETPRKRKMRLEIKRSELMIKKQKKTIKLLQKRTSRYRKKIASLTEVLRDLKEKNFISSNETAHLENLGVNDLIDRYRKTVSSNQSTSTKFSPALRTFACTLHFYSPKAYEYVRQKFQTCLPHIRTIKKWYESVDAEPGFTQESLKALKHKAESTNYKQLCNLVLDEMSIRQGIEWDGKKMHGYVDICNKGKSGDYLAEAKEALVFLVTSINGAFKIPVGYFFVAGVTGEQRSNLVKQCLELLEETGIQITSLTFDGCPANVTMAKELGCSFDIHNLKTHFLHPITSEPIFIFLDPCHMLKLVRNAFEAYGVFIDHKNRNIKWAHLMNLNNIQEKENLHLANKLRHGHIFFKNQKMKVRLASQLFSNSVADTLIFCSEQKWSNFENVEGTVNFLQIINNLFDILNSRNMAQFSYKKPLFPGNKDDTFKFLNTAETFLTTLKLHDGTLIVESGRKTGFIGFLTCIKSLKNIYIKFVEKETKLKYIPAYKISQDHLELMFGHIRAHGGCNTNPTARQFQAIYKKLLVKAELRDVDKGNCIFLEEISFLTCSSAVQNINLTVEARNVEENSTDLNALHEQACFDDEVNVRFENISEFGSQAVTYIAGFVVHALVKTLKCETCIGAIIADKIDGLRHGFIKLKDKGGLMYPSLDVINICKRMEAIIKTTIMNNNDIALTTKFVKQQITSKALTHFIGMNMFSEINFHQFEQPPINNHLTLLIKAVMEKYLNIRLHYLTKYATPKVSKRQVLSKYLHFTGQ